MTYGVTALFDLELLVTKLVYSTSPTLLVGFFMQVFPDMMIRYACGWIFNSVIFYGFTTFLNVAFAAAKLVYATSPRLISFEIVLV